MTDWKYQVAALVEAGRRERANSCIRLGLYPTAGAFYVGVGESATGPVTHWILTTAARAATAPLMPGAARVAAEISAVLDTETIDEHGMSQVIERTIGGQVRAAWAVVSQLVDGVWTPPIPGTRQDYLDQWGLVPVSDFDAVEAAEAAEASAGATLEAWARLQSVVTGSPGGGVGLSRAEVIDLALRDEVTDAIDEYLTSVGANRLAILGELGIGTASGAALLM